MGKTYNLIYTVYGSLQKTNKRPPQKLQHIKALHKTKTTAN
jgi:hypothetical protein